MSASTDRLMMNLRTRLPGALDPVIQLELFNAINEFCQQSNVWRNDVTITRVANEDTYTVTPLDDGNINRLLWAFDTTNWNSAVNGVPSPAKCLPIGATMATPGVLILHHTPSQAGTFVATIALTVQDPTDTNNLPDLPDWIYDKYWSDFQDGTLFKMMSQPAKPYTNPQMAVYHGRRWQGAISKGRIEAQRNNVYRAQAWGFPGLGARMTRPRR